MGEVRRRVVVIQPFAAEAMRVLQGRADLEVAVVAHPGDAALPGLLAEAEAITVRDAPLTPALLSCAPRLRVVARHGVGFDNVPVDHCTERGIPVALVGAVNVVAVAEHAMMLMLMAARRAVELDAAVRRGAFAERARLTGVELGERTLLVVGFGRIGREVARRAEAFGMAVVLHDPARGPGDPRHEPDLDAALARADVVSLHLPLTQATRGLLGAVRISRMRPGSILVNTARGGLVDEAALAEALRSGHLRAAALDTFATEPPPRGSALLAEPRAVLSPHAAALTEEALLAMGMATARNVLAGLDGTLDPTLVVNAAAIGERRAHA